MGELDRLERWMLRVVAHPDGVDAGFDAAREEGLLPEGATTLSDVVPGNDRLSPAQQLHIYAFAYFDRIADVLAGEYPTVQHLLSPEHFRRLLREFLVDRPSAAYSLNRVGLPFADWLAERSARVAKAQPSLSAKLAFAVDVAIVERTMDEVWDEPFADPVPFEQLQAIPLDSWADVHLETIPALALLELAHPVTGAMNAARDGEAIEVPAPTPTWICVYRDDRQRWRFDLSFEQHGLLAALTDDASLGEAIEAVATSEGADVAAMMGGLGEWFKEWMGSGLFCSVRGGD